MARDLGSVVLALRVVLPKAFNFLQPLDSTAEHGGRRHRPSPSAELLEAHPEHHEHHNTIRSPRHEVLQGVEPRLHPSAKPSFLHEKRPRGRRLGAT